MRDPWTYCALGSATFIVAGVWGLAGWPWASIAAGLMLALPFGARVWARAHGRS